MSEETSYECALDTLNTAILFLILLVLGILLSLKSVLTQRESLCTIMEGVETDCLESPYPFQCAAGAITIGALGYFFTLALQSWNDACRSGDERAICLARMSLWAAVFVLCAAILRFLALKAVQQSPEGPSLDEELPA